MPEGEATDFIFYTTQSISDIFEVSVETVRDWISRGELKAMRITGGQFRISKSDLESFIASRYAAEES